MTTENAMTLLDFAALTGRDHAAAFLAEFGEPITMENAGDWDATSLGEAWRDATYVYAIDEPRRHDNYQAFRLAYLKALYGRDDVT
jgi:hypothetical protein